MDKQLKDCPFCGGNAEIERMGNNKQSMIVACTNCGARTECGATTIDNCHWNYRAKPSPLCEIVQLCEELRKKKINVNLRSSRTIIDIIPAGINRVKARAFMVGKDEDIAIMWLRTALDNGGFDK